MSTSTIKVATGVAVAAWRERGPHSLAGLVDEISYPAGEHGEDYLTRVRDYTVDAVLYVVDEGDAEDILAEDYLSEAPHHDVADAVVPVYTADVWRTFTDLGAWEVDTRDYIGDDADMTRKAEVALYVVAERLAAEILDDIVSVVRDAVAEAQA